VKLSREKLIHLSHVVVDAIEKTPDVALKRDRNDVRLAALEVLKEAMKREDDIDAAVRRKITSQKKEIVEGSREWDVVYRKYHEEEASRYRKVR
jgi:hypothetical protein